jgi:Predicted permease
MKQEKKNNYYRFVLIGLLLLLAIIIFKELQAYLGGFLAAVALYSILRGQMKKWVEKRKWRRGLSATVIVLGAVIFILIPLTGIGLLVADTLSGIEINPEQITTAMDNFATYLEEKLGIAVFTPENLSFVPRAGTSLMQTLVSGLISMVINSIIAIFLLYFMLVGYDTLEKATVEILPFREENKNILREETKSIIQANAIGIPLVAIIQGMLAYVGYMFFGVNNPLVYAVLVAFTTIIPIVGTSLVWVPIGIAALVEGNIAKGILLLAYGLLIIGGSDAVIRFMLQKKLANIHPLITFFGVLIGLSMFGFWGIVFGPLLVSLLLLFFNMYRHNYISGSTAQPRVTTREDFQSNIWLRRKQRKR